MRNRKEEYQRYLASPEWKELRAKARERSGNKCEFCGGPPEHVHHVRYPKRYKEDHLDNLVVACEPCHSKLHGVRDSLMVDDWIGEAIGLELKDNKLHVRMKFDPMPVDMRDPQPYEKFVQKVGKEHAENVLNQLGGHVLEIGMSFETLVPIDNHLISHHSEWSAAEFLEEILAYANTPYSKPELDADSIGGYVLSGMSVGPVSCVCK